MLEGTLSLGQALFSGWWNMLSVTVPGFTFNFREMYLGIMICSLSLLVLKIFFGLGVRGGGTSYRSGSSHKPKISKEREKDEL